MVAKPLSAIQLSVLGKRCCSLNISKIPILAVTCTHDIYRTIKIFGTFSMPISIIVHLHKEFRFRPIKKNPLWILFDWELCLQGWFWGLYSLCTLKSIQSLGVIFMFSLPYFVYNLWKVRANSNFNTQPQLFWTFLIQWW